jgi:hypothetical protein
MGVTKMIQLAQIDINGAHLDSDNWNAESLLSLCHFADRQGVIVCVMDCVDYPVVSDIEMAVGVVGRYFCKFSEKTWEPPSVYRHKDGVDALGILGDRKEVGVLGGCDIRLYGTDDFLHLCVIPAHCA